MAITIYEIIASDTISQMADKVNYNFDQLLQNGGGPAGPQGPQGPFGPTGPQGVQGPQGIRGSKWFQGSSFPSSGVNSGDLFLDSSGIVYEYNGSSWTNTGIDLVGTGTVWDQLDGSSTSISTSLPLYRFRYVRPSYDLSVETSSASNEQAILIGAAPFGAADDQGIAGTPVDYVSDTYSSNINTDNGSLFVHAPKELGIGKNIVLSRVKGDGSSSYNTDIVSDMSYVTLDVADGVEITGQKRVTNSSIYGSYPDGILINTTDSRSHISSGRNVLIETVNPITPYSVGVFGADNSVGNVTIHAKESTISGYAGAALTLKKGTSGAYGDAIIVLGNSDPTAIPTVGDGTIYMRNAGTSSDIVMLSGRSIVTTSGRSFAINTAGTDNISLDVRGANSTSQLLSIKQNNGTEAFGLGSNGRLTQALAFPSTGVPSNDPNSLDYYEEGSWNPVLSVFNPLSISGTFGTSGTSVYSVKKARYTRVGNMITVDAVFGITIPSSLPCPGSPDYYQSGLIVTGFPYQPDIEHSSLASSGTDVEYGMPFYSAGAHNIAGNCSTIPIAGTVKASFYCASTSGSAMAFYINDSNNPGAYYKNMRRLSFIDYQGSTDGVLNFSASYLVSGAPGGNPCSGATSGSSGSSGTSGAGTGFQVLSMIQAPLSPNTLTVENTVDFMTWTPVANLSRSLAGTSTGTSLGLNESAYYRATLTNNTFGTSTWFQGLTWSVDGGGSTSASPVSTSAVGTVQGDSVTWYAPSPWTPGEKYIWEGRFGSLPTIDQVGNEEYFPNYRIQTFAIGPSVSAGNKYTLMVYSVPVVYVAQPGDSPYNVAFGLMDAINSTTPLQWNAYGSAPVSNPYFPPQATMLNNTVIVTLNWQNSFAAYASIN